MLDKVEDMEHDPTANRNREPTDNMEDNMNVDNVEEEEEVDEGEVDDVYDEDELVDDEFGPQEFSALNNQLDQLQSALDSLESRNDDIHFKLLDLLRSNREIRQGINEENRRKQEVGGGCESNDQGPSPSGSDSSKLVRNDSTSSAGTSSNNSIGKDMPKAE